ncbi:redox-sensitive transcriptional activator SoxR [uncultured Tateyamaria sp.]|uniref:redox-sensitive transcriptional activator SoxR n=1 Tax=uncultured Tateyamaria sp. TaxID=455651 RepID=UPI00261D7950|nr:redox-sensitive transcriptional activator SoxR [uncultured Tateyamaria sp.]
MSASEGLSIGEIAARTGLAVSAIRYYEAEGLIAPWRNSAGRRRFQRADIRRLSFVMIAQQFGFTLPQIRVELDRLPRHRAPTKADWTRISQTFRTGLDTRIARLERLRDTLDGCIGCGCLSLEACALYNPKDRAAARGTGPRYLMGDSPDM